MIEAIFHGHSFVEINWNDTCILIDPFIEGNTQCEKWVDEFTNKNLHAIVVTHAHFDHIWQTLDIAKATWCTVIVTYEVWEYFQREWLPYVSSQSIWWAVEYEWYSIEFTPALHGGGNYDLWICWIAAWVLIRIGDKTVYHAWDTWLTKEFELIGENAIDIAFIPIGWRFTMDIAQAVRSIPMLTPRRVVPIHYNTRKPIQQDPNIFATQIMQQWIAVPKVLRSWQMIVID